MSVHNHEPLRPDFMGKNGFVWWQGVVEDVMDPLKLGRVRVRVLGWHTEDKTAIPTESLPWASIVLPANSPFISGKGWSPNGLVQGCWVVGFFRDGINGQEPVVFGTIGGMNLFSVPVPEKKDVPVSYLSTGSEESWIKLKMKALRDRILNLYKATRYDAGLKAYQLPKNPLVDTNQGFNDPTGKYPLISRIGEPDTNRLARAENLSTTIVNLKNNSRDSCETAIAGYWAEPLSPYAAQYPYNHVYESEAGHVIEYDDTPGAERMHWYHCSGTFTEIHPKGSEVHKVIGNAWDITLNDKMILVRGNASFNSDKTMKINIGKDLDVEVGGDVKLYIRGNMTTDVGGNFLHKVRGSYTAVSEGPMLLMAPRIDLNPAGEKPSAINTLLNKARSFVNGLIVSMSPQDTVVQPSPDPSIELEDTLSTVTIKDGIAKVNTAKTGEEKAKAIQDRTDSARKEEKADKNTHWIPTEKGEDNRRRLSRLVLELKDNKVRHEVIRDLMDRGLNDKKIKIVVDEVSKIGGSVKEQRDVAIVIAKQKRFI